MRRCGKESRKGISLWSVAIICYHERERLVKNTQERRVLEKTKEGQFDDTVNLPVQSSSETKPKVSLGLLS